MLKKISVFHNYQKVMFDDDILKMILNYSVIENRK